MSLIHYLVSSCNVPHTLIALHTSTIISIRILYFAPKSTSTQIIFGMLYHLTARRYLKTVPRLFLVSNELLNPEALAKIPTHELFTKLGFVNHPKPGLVHWLPMGVAILTNLKALVGRHMQSADAEEVSMSTLSHSSLWEKTGRWGGSELFKLKDSSGQDYCLAPTCEEDITNLVKNSVSYHALPLLYYQINTKFRDEKRPRSGLLRGREFIMKDAYSFDATETDAMKTYEKMVKAYYGIFNVLKVPFVKAEADSGDIGGSLSHEWHYVHKHGEDTLFTCNDCGTSSNIEKTISYPVGDYSGEVGVRYFTTKDKGTLVCAYYPAERTLQPNFIRSEIPDLDLEEQDQGRILQLFSDEDAMINKQIVRVMDSRLNSQSNFPDFPINFVNRLLMTTLTDIPIVEAFEGEICGSCEEGTLELSRAIEIGHTFYLGDKYTSALDCSVDTPVNGKTARTNVLMGCYGIGISRIIASVAEINRDEYGFRWPAAIAPWEVTVVEAAGSGTELAEKLSVAGVDCRLDNRPKVGLGRKIAHSNLVGIPLVAIVGKRYPTVEIEVRGKQYTESWRRAYDERDFEWEVTANKHTVSAENSAKVVKALLADM